MNRSSGTPDRRSTIRELASQIAAYGILLGRDPPLDAAQADALLEAACESLLDDSDLDRFSISLGFWLGEWLVVRHAADWVGLDEPVPPRVQRGAVIVSPIDAVQRRIEREEAPSLVSLVAEFLALSSRAMPDREPTLARNQAAWDTLSSDVRFAEVAIRKLPQYEAQASLDPWLRGESLSGARILLLGGAGGTHAALHAMAGASVTVVDLSPAQLAIDRGQAEALGLDLRLLTGSADDLSMLESDSFDWVVQPVLTCYLPNVIAIYREVHRVLKPGGGYLSQHKHSVPLRLLWNSDRQAYELPCDSIEPQLPNDPAGNHPLRESTAQEFAHGLGTLLGDLCRTGFVIEAFQEPIRSDLGALPGTLAHLANVASPYFKVKARKADVTHPDRP